MPQDVDYSSTIYRWNDIVNNGTRANASLYFSKLSVRDVHFSSGFPSESGSALTDSNGNTLVEWFALELDTELALNSTTDTPGWYQLGIISDDGSMMFVNGAKVTDTDRRHPDQSACSTTAYYMNYTTRLPVKIKNFQGRRWTISLELIWRKVPDDSASALSSINGQPLVFDTGGVAVERPDDCNMMPYYDTYGKSLAWPYWSVHSGQTMSRWDDMYGRGWRTIPPQNLFMPSSGINPCY